MTEMRDGRPGGTLATQHLAHLMLLRAFRLHLSRQAGTALACSMHSPTRIWAIEAMHADRAYRWTLAELANRGRAVTVDLCAAVPRQSRQDTDRLFGALAHDARNRPVGKWAGAAW